MDNLAAKTVLSVCATTASRLKDLVIKDGQLIFIQDKHRIALDFKGQRVFYNQIEELETDYERTTMDSPVSGAFYFIIETAVLWTYCNGWIPLTTPPEEIVFIGVELPELGQPHVIYANKKEKNISVWDEDTTTYVEVADTTGSLSTDEIDALFI